MLMSAKTKKGLSSNLGKFIRLGMRILIFVYQVSSQLGDRDRFSIPSVLTLPVRVIGSVMISEMTQVSLTLYHRRVVE